MQETRTSTQLEYERGQLAKARKALDAKAAEGEAQKQRVQELQGSIERLQGQVEALDEQIAAVKAQYDSVEAKVGSGF